MSPDLSVVDALLLTMAVAAAGVGAVLLAAKILLMTRRDRRRKP